MLFTDEFASTATLEPKPVRSALKVLSFITLLIIIFAAVMLAAGSALKTRGFM